jgi:high-affinity iron transporter
MLVLLVLPDVAAAQQTPPWRAAEQIQQALFKSQTALLTDADPLMQIADAEQGWQTSVAPELRVVAPGAAAQVDQALADARAAVEHKDAGARALARGNTWTALLGGAYQATLQAVTNNQPDQAQQWVLLREYRTATRFSRLDADATLALAAWRDGTRTSDDARAAVVADLLDTYQARLTDALATINGTSVQGFAVRRAGSAGVAQGYWRIVAHAYAEQRGAEAQPQIDAAFTALVVAVQHNDDAARTAAQHQIGEALRDL